MRQPDAPPDEETRLRALRSLHILDTPPEERFDRLTRMAKRLFGVPIALVSLVDENRQWFKSCVGLSASETPRDISFCGHAILGDEVFTIPDATMDERFADNPLVLDGPRIRFYAGCPLRHLDGSKLGTLCIIDREPRTLDAEDLATLKDLASMVEREMGALQLATVDELTGAHNRRGFMMLAQNSLSICTRQKMPASLVYLDLDRFKAINDKFGHAEGDRALTTFTRQLMPLCRDSDLLGRLGGDEFVMLLTNSPGDRAQDVVARMREALAAHDRQASRGYHMSFSHGVVELDPARHRTVEDLLADADSLMYQRKKRSRGSEKEGRG